MKSCRPKKPPLMIQRFPSMKQPFQRHLDEHMFIEDIHLGIMPIGSISAKSTNFHVLFKGSDQDQELTKRICHSLTSHTHHSDPRELLADVVESIAEYLSWSGISYYEIIEDIEDSCCPYLYWFSSKNLWKLPGYFVQIIPKEDIKLFKRRSSVIKSSSVWEITVPPILGGHQHYKKILKRLKNTNSLTPKFAQKEIGLMYSTPGYDFKTYNRNQDVLINRITDKWGWNRRNIHIENCTEFYSIYKHLSFSWAKSVLREHIVAELNILLTRLGIHCIIEIHGLPKSNDISNYRDELLSGKIDFDKAYKLVSFFY